MPLALTLGLHLLLVLTWLTGARGPAPEPAPRTSTLVLVHSLPRSPPPPSPPPVIPKSRARQPDAFIAPAPEAAPISIPAPATPEPDSAPSPDAAAPALPGDLLANAKAMAGRVDRALSEGGSPISAEPERKWERFADAFAAARTSAPPVTLESYEAPDGVTIYRKTVAGRTSCYRSGSVGGLVTGFGNADLHGAGRTTCPTSVSWTRQ